MSRRRRKRRQRGDCQRCERQIPDGYVSDMVIVAQGVEQRVRMCPCCALLQRNQMHGLPLNEPFGGETAQTMLIVVVEHLLATKQEVKSWELEAAFGTNDPIERATEWIET